MDSSGVSRWRQVSDRLVREIGGGGFAPGDKLPPDIDLAVQFGVARQTMRRALAHLRSQGLLRIEQGRGTFLTEKIFGFRIGGKAWFEQNLLENQALPRRKIVELRREEAAVSIAEQLRLAPGEHVTVVRIAGEADGVALGTGENFFPAGRFAQLDDAFDALSRDGRHFSFFALLADIGYLDLRRQTMRLRARAATEEERQHLALPDAEYVLETESLIVDQKQQPVFCSFMSYASSRVEFYVDPTTLAS